MAVKNNQKVTMKYELRIDGELLDNSQDNGVSEFIFGTGQVIAGLEKRIMDMNIGDSKEVIVPSSEAYGEYDINAKQVFLKEHFGDEELEIGTQLEATGEDGYPVYATVSDIMDKEIVLDLNHPLAGKELHFSITIEAIE